MDSRYDVLIVGARCAGASTAMLLARAGLKVLVVDRAPAGSDTLSTHALMRGGVLQLHRWGLLDAVAGAGTPPIRTTTFHYDDEAIEIAIKPRDGVDALYGPRRPVIDGILVAAARQAGAEVVHEVRAIDLLRDVAGRVRGAVLQTSDGSRLPVRADLVVGADGLRSRVARLAGARIEARGEHASGLVYGYFEGLENRGFHWHYRPGVSIGVIPTNDGRACVFAAMPERRFRELLPSGLEAMHRQIVTETSREVAQALGGARRDGRILPFSGVRGFLRRSHGPGWALVGDSGSFRDPITAHGITDALRDAELLASAVLDGSEHALARYQRQRDAIARGMLETTDRVASFAWTIEEVKVLHLELSRQMNAEVDLLRGRGPFPAAAATGDHAPSCPMSRPLAAVGPRAASQAANADGAGARPFGLLSRA